MESAKKLGVLPWETKSGIVMIGTLETWNPRILEPWNSQSLQPCNPGNLQPTTVQNFGSLPDKIATLERNLLLGCKTGFMWYPGCHKPTSFVPIFVKIWGWLYHSLPILYHIYRGDRHNHSLPISKRLHILHNDIGRAGRASHPIADTFLVPTKPAEVSLGRDPKTHQHGQWMDAGDIWKLDTQLFLPPMIGIEKPTSAISNDFFWVIHKLSKQT